MKVVLFLSCALFAVGHAAESDVWMCGQPVQRVQNKGWVDWAQGKACDFWSGFGKNPVEKAILCGVICGGVGMAYYYGYDLFVFGATGVCLYCQAKDSWQKAWDLDGLSGNIASLPEDHASPHRGVVCKRFIKRRRKKKIRAW